MYPKFDVTKNLQIIYKFFGRKQGLIIRSVGYNSKSILTICLPKPNQGALLGFCRGLSRKARGAAAAATVCSPPFPHLQPRCRW
jgi:hypothetical protein